MSETVLKILVTGATGQLGQAIKEESNAYDRLHFIFLSKTDLDITNTIHLEKILDMYLPDVIINTAAYTAVDRAEEEIKQAFLINEKGVENVARACKSRNIKLLHISTDYVFDGTSKVPYKETDPANPQTVYGRSKLAGESVLKSISPETYFIIRASWLYSNKEHNFYNTMLRLAGDGKEISVVNDQWGTPTLANDLAKVLIHIAIIGKSFQNGMYHYSSCGECSWYAFAKAILDKEFANDYTLKPVSTQQYPTAAKRPKYSVLNTQKIEETFGVKIRDWKKTLLEL